MRTKEREDEWMYEGVDWKRDCKSMNPCSVPALLMLNKLAALCWVSDTNQNSIEISG